MQLAHDKMLISIIFCCCKSNAQKHCKIYPRFVVAMQKLKLPYFYFSATACLHYIVSSETQSIVSYFLSDLLGMILGQIMEYNAQQLTEKCQNSICLYKDDLYKASFHGDVCISPKLRWFLKSRGSANNSSLPAPWKEPLS